MTKENIKYLKIAGGVAAVIVLYKIVVPKSDTSGSVTDPTQSGGGSTIPGYVFNANTVANELYEAMRYTGTDEERMIKALNPVSATQFNAVIAAFKNRSYNKTMGNQINYFPLTPLPLHNLQFWMKNELSDTRYNFFALRYPQL